MKKSLLHKSNKPSRTTQEIQTVALIVISAAVVVLSCTVAVLLAQADSQRKSIEGLYNITTGLPTSETLGR